MLFSLKKSLYERIPLPLKKLCCQLPFSWLAGKKYREAYNRGRWFDLAAREEILAYQEKALSRLLRHATLQVPAYQSLKGVVAKFKPLEALNAFPFIEKEELQREIDRFLPRNFDEIPSYETTTGGTSGNQLKFFLDDSSQSMEMGFMHRQWKRVDYSPNDRKAVFRGVSFHGLKPNVFWQENPIYNELQFSPFHMSEKNLGLYFEEFVRFAPKFVHGYPSAIEIFAEFIARNDLTGKLPAIRAVLLGSEGASDEQRRRIERGLRSKTYAWYGLSERVALGGECEKNTSYHLMPDYAYVELIREDGSSCLEAGERGEIVGTNLFNFSLPLIRYKTGDFAEFLPPTCECGRSWNRIGKVSGRWKKEFVIGRSGARISTAALNMHGDLFESVLRYQYFQERLGKLVVKILPKPDFSDLTRSKIESAYQRKVGDELAVEVKIVEDIPLTEGGKLKMLDSRIGSEENSPQA